MYREVIERCRDEMRRLAGVRDYEKLIGILTCYKKGIWSEIHEVLSVNKTVENEKLIREIIAKDVIGYIDGRKSYVGALQIITGLLSMSRNKRGDAEIRQENLSRLVDLYDDFMALASFRSYEHFCKYLENEYNITLWRDTDNCFKGYWFYANRMIIDGSVKFIEKQLPTGYGKSLSDAFMQAYIFGNDINADILKVCGNDKFTEDCIMNVHKLMTSKRYAKVFPYFSRFKNDPSSMFSFFSKKDLKFSLTGSTKTTSLRIVTKLSDVNGVRAKYLFLDDITQRSDMGSIKAHDKDIHSFQHEWFERNYSRNNFYVIASGTTYSMFDLLSWLKVKFGGENALKSPINKYTKIGKSNMIVKDGISVFICVPLLDYDTMTSTYEKKISTESALKKKEDSYEEFMAMDQQTPLAPDENPFYYSKLQQYETLPAINTRDRTKYHWAALDTKRRGSDNLSMPIMSEINGKYYVVDWLYDNRGMKELIPFIVNKIIQHDITNLIVERNTEECIASILTDKLAEKGYYSCQIYEIYSTIPKDKRIAESESDIKSYIVFPKLGLYAKSSDMGKALDDVYSYNYTGKGIKHDDAPDSLALFVKKFIIRKHIGKAKIEIIK